MRLPGGLHQQLRAAPGLGLRLFARGDVGAHPNKMLHLVQAVARGGDGHLNIEQVAVLVAVDHLALPAAFFQQVAPELDVKSSVVQARVQEPGIASHHLGCTVAGHAGKGRVDRDDAAVDVCDGDGLCAGVEHGGADAPGAGRLHALGCMDNLATVIHHRKQAGEQHDADHDAQQRDGVSVPRLQGVPAVQVGKQHEGVQA